MTSLFRFPAISYADMATLLSIHCLCTSIFSLLDDMLQQSPSFNIRRRLGISFSHRSCALHMPLYTRAAMQKFLS